MGALGSQLWRGALSRWLWLVPMPTWTIHTTGGMIIRNEIQRRSKWIESRIMCKCFTAKTRFAGQRPVDQQCDLLWRETRQMRHQHHCHHRKCLNASSRGKFSLKKSTQFTGIVPGGPPWLRWRPPCSSVWRLETRVLSPSRLCLHDVVSSS